MIERHDSFFYFLKSSGLFIIIGCLLLGGVTVYNKKLMDVAYRRDVFKFGKGINTIIIGDSHTQTALNPCLIPGSVNVSKSRESFFYSYYKLKYLLNLNPDVVNVVIGFSYHNMSKLFTESIMHEPNSLESYYYMLDNNGIKLAKEEHNNYCPASVGIGLSGRLI